MGGWRWQRSTVCEGLRYSRPPCARGPRALSPVTRRWRLRRRRRRERAPVVAIFRRPIDRTRAQSPPHGFPRHGTAHTPPPPTAALRQAHQRGFYLYYRRAIPRTDTRTAGEDVRYDSTRVKENGCVDMYICMDIYVWMYMCMDAEACQAPPSHSILYRAGGGGEDERERGGDVTDGGEQARTTRETEEEEEENRRRNGGGCKKKKNSNR